MGLLAVEELQRRRVLDPCLVRRKGRQGLPSVVVHPAGKLPSREGPKGRDGGDALVAGIPVLLRAQVPVESK